MSSVWQSISHRAGILVPGLASIPPRRRREYLAFLGFVAPNFILFGVFTFWPLVYSLLLSFKKWNMISPTKEFVALANYVKIIGDDVLWQASRNTLYLAGGTVSIKLALALMLALLGYSKDEPLDWGNLEFKNYNARYTLAEETQIRALREKGIAVNLWTVNEERDMRRFIAAGVAGLITDFPQRLRALLQ
jgi:hypothetical protein